jgi:acetylglutamate kinase
MITPNETASLLIQALPYIRRFTGKILVLKVGGLPMTDPERARSLAKDVLLLHSVGIRPVLVHGGGPQIDDLMRKLGKSPEFRDGLRVTDGETLDLVRMVLVGKINRELVSALNALEPVAVGVAGEDGRLLEAAQVDPKLGFVGKVGAVRAGLLHALLDDGLVPIVSTVGSDASGQPYNINADDAARAIAVAMGAEKLVYLTGAAGLLDDPNDPSTLVHCLTPAEARARIDATGVSGGMIPKLTACAEAVEGGVGSAHMIDGRAEHAILIELFTDSGIGTMVRPEGAA